MIKKLISQIKKYIWLNVGTLCTVILLTTSALQGCGTSSDGFFQAALGMGSGSIFVSNTSGTGYTISVYDLDGNFQRLLIDTSVSGKILRGMAEYDLFHIIVAMDTPDQLVKVNTITGAISSFANSSLFTGTIYQVATTASNTYFAIETNNVEKFLGSRRDPPAGNAFIATTLGACTLSGPRGLAVNSAGNLLVTSATNSQIQMYDVSGASATCLVSDASFGAQTPVPIAVHSNGNLYFGTQADDALYSAAEDLSTAPTIVGSSTGTLLNPSAMAILPNGNILIALDGTDSIVLVDPTTGEILNSTFIRSAFTTSVTSIYVLSPQ